MLYVTCPSCGFFIGQKISEYEEKKKDICTNPKLTKEDRDKQLSELLLSLNLRRYCCKMRVMSYCDLVNIIIPVN